MRSASPRALAIPSSLRPGRRKEKRLGRRPRTATKRFSPTVRPLNSSEVW